MKPDLSQLKALFPKPVIPPVRDSDGRFRFDPGFVTLFQMASWVFGAAVLVMLVLCGAVWDLKMSAATAVLWAAAPLMCIPALLLADRVGDQVRGWQTVTVFSFVTLAMLSLAMYMWVDTAHGTFDKDMFFDTVAMARNTVAVWAVYAVLNLVGFIMMVFTCGRMPAPAPAPGDASAEPEEEQSEEPSAVSAYRRDMDVILDDIRRFSSPSALGLVEKDGKGGN